jgi:hypothetical protein
MKPAKGYYCLIQYCPDLSRLEAANIGVLLFSPDREFLKARTVRHNRRIRRFFGREGHDWSRINSFKGGIEHRLEVEHASIRSLADLERFIALCANEIQISPPRPIRVDDPEADLKALFEDLVGGAHQDAKSAALTELRRTLSEKFTRAAIDRKLRRNVPVVVPVFNERLEIPYAYQNGRCNLIQPVAFEATDPVHTMRSACRYAVEGRFLFENPDPDLGLLRLVVVGRFRSRDPQARQGVGRIFERDNVQLYQSGDVDRLVDDIKRTGRDIEPVAEAR